VAGGGSGGGYSYAVGYTYYQGGVGGGGYGIGFAGSGTVYPGGGLPNTGSGGGGGGWNGDYGGPPEYGGPGGSGMVLIRYALCSQCQTGTYSTGVFAANACQNCSAGAFAGAAASACTNCSVGSYQPKATATACVNCTRCADAATTDGVCPMAALTDTQTCRCNPGWYGSGTVCSQCPAHSLSIANSTASLLSCRCLAGYVCTYTKRITVVVHMHNMTLAAFTANYQAAFALALADAAGVSVSQVSIIVPGRRLLASPLTIRFHVHGADGLHGLRHHMQRLRRTAAFELAWEHAHSLRIRPLPLS
jgi:hypothetical protein